MGLIDMTLQFCLVHRRRIVQKSDSSLRTGKGATLIRQRGPFVTPAFLCHAFLCCHNLVFNVVASRIPRPVWITCIVAFIQGITLAEDVGESDVEVVVTPQSTISYEAIRRQTGIAPDVRCGAPHFLRDGSAVLLEMGRQIINVTLPANEIANVSEKTPQPIIGIAANDQNLVAAACVDGSVIVFDSATGKQTYASPQRIAGAVRVLWTKHEGRLLVGTSGSVYSLNISTQEKPTRIFRCGGENEILGHIHSIEGTNSIGCVTTKAYYEVDSESHTQRVVSLDIIPAGGWRSVRHPTKKQYLSFFCFAGINDQPTVDGGMQNYLMTYDIAAERPVSSVELPGRSVTTMAYDQTGRVLVIAGSLLRRTTDDRSVRAFLTTERLPEIEWPVEKNKSYSFVEFSADGRWHLFASQNECVICSYKITRPD